MRMQEPQSPPFEILQLTEERTTGPLTKGACEQTAIGHGKVRVEEGE